MRAAIVTSLWFKGSRGRCCIWSDPDTGCRRGLADLGAQILGKRGRGFHGDSLFPERTFCARGCGSRHRRSSSAPQTCCRREPGISGVAFAAARRRSPGTAAKGCAPSRVAAANHVLHHLLDGPKSLVDQTLPLQFPSAGQCPRSFLRASLHFIRLATGHGRSSFPAGPKIDRATAVPGQAFVMRNVPGRFSKLRILTTGNRSLCDAR
jgi:hypothetical protein